MKETVSRLGARLPAPLSGATRSRLPAFPAVISAVPEPVAESVELRGALAGVQLRSVYQPIVELDTGAVVAYEALVRGPRGTALESPDRLFAAARRAKCVAGLDRACQIAAFEGAKASGLRKPWSLFVNVEPAAANAALLAATTDDLDGYRIVVELTERALVADPPQLLQLVARIRSLGWGIALDDVGANRDSLALLPLLCPDVIKLDLRLVQQRATGELAQIVSAVNAEAERSGTVILAEGIETEEHLQVAWSLGAVLGQGWMLGRPSDLPLPLPQFKGTPIAVNHREELVPRRTPFALGSALKSPRPVRKALLIEISKHLERQAMVAGESAVILSTFQDASFFTPLTRGRYEKLVTRAAFVGALAENMPAEPLPGVRGCVLDVDDPLIGEWDITVVGPHFAATLVARDLGDDGPDAERRFEFVLSHERNLAIQVALALMWRVWPRR